MDYAQWTWVAWQLLGFVGVAFGDYRSKEQEKLAFTTALLGITISDIILYWGGFFS